MDYCSATLFEDEISSYPTGENVHLHINRDYKAAVLIQHKENMASIPTTSIATLENIRSDLNLLVPVPHLCDKNGKMHKRTK